MPEEIIENGQSKPTISPREIIFKYIRYVPWVVLSVSMMLILAWVKLRYSTPIYSISGRLLVTSQSNFNNNEKFDDIFMSNRNDKIPDEIEIIKSRSIASRVVKSLGLQMQVHNKGKIRSTIIHPREVPFNFDIMKIGDSTAGFSLTILFTGNEQFQLNEQPRKYFFNEVVDLGYVVFRIQQSGNNNWGTFASREFVVAWLSIEQMAGNLSSAITVNRVNDFSNVLNLAFQTENMKLGADIVNQYMKEYQQGSLEDKREIASRTLRFIDQQLDTVFKDLTGVETNLLNYRQRNKVIDPQVQSSLYFSELSESSKQRVQHGVSVRMIDFLLNHLSKKENQYTTIPSMSMPGIEDPAMLQQVTEFNRLQLERETALKNTLPNNPRILTIEAAIEKLRTDMMQTLTNVRHTHELALEEINRRNREADLQISAIPGREKQQLEITRRQNILQELHSYLLQKKLETSIASASTISNIKVVEPALPAGRQVSPNRKALYMIAIMLGIVIPAAIVFLLEYLNDKVKSRNEIEQMTSAPILGEIGHADEANTLVVTRNNRQYIAEQFRIVRSNLQYIIPKIDKPVIMVTSSFSGEGKSFVSTNIGAVLAISGKRTVILEFDIRKPKILKGLGLNERKGITNYIVGNVDVQNIIYPVPEVENLFVIPCGPVPPNPAEMLLDPKVKELFEELRKKFDTVIVDTAPVGLVSDSITLGKNADAVVYIIRHNYTLKKQLGLIDDLYTHKKLPHLSIIINDIDARSGYGGYYGYGGYGYGGYGYGYGSDYFENGRKKKKSIWKRLLGKSARG